MLRIIKLFILINLIIVSSVFCHHESRLNFFNLIFGSKDGRHDCSCKCGIPNRSARVLGGERLQPHEFPWLAFINFQGILPIPGTLLNDRYVITAASSLVGLTPYDLKVTLGAHYNCHLESTTTNYSVSNILMHPDFGSGYKVNNIALIKLSTLVVYERTIIPICLPTPGSSYMGQVSTIASWIDSLSPESLKYKTCEPRKVGLPILSSKSCPNYLFDSQGCIGVIGLPSVLCKNDAGSGVLYRTYKGYYELVGVLSDAQSCELSDSGPIVDSSEFSIPVYTKVGHHLNWILSNTKDGCYCNKL